MIIHVYMNDPSPTFHGTAHFAELMKLQLLIQWDQDGHEHGLVLGALTMDVQGDLLTFCP